MATKRKAAAKPRSRYPARKTPTFHKVKRASRLFLPYPIFIFLMLAVGVLLANWTFNAGAIDYTIRGKVPGPALTEPAIIESPTTGTRFSVVPITVSGSCPSDSYVELYRNIVFSGTAVCSAGQFEIQTDLFEGENELLAKVFNITDDEGPASDPVTVYYDIPDPPPEEPGTSGSGEPAAPPAKPFTISSDFRYRGFLVGQTIGWELEISGGTPPYAISVDWGDGSSSVISRRSGGKFTVEHRYDEPAGGNGYYTIKISAADSENRKTFLQLFVLVTTEDIPGSGIGTNLPGLPPIDFSFSRELLRYIWPAYGIVLLMAVSFWLGEREELLVLKKRGAIRKRRS